MTGLYASVPITVQQDVKTDRYTFRGGGDRLVGVACADCDTPLPADTPNGALFLRLDVGLRFAAEHESLFHPGESR